MLNFFKRVIVIPEKLTAWAAAGILWLTVQGLILLSNATGIDFTGIDGTVLAVALATVLTMIVKAVLEAYIPETWHTYINSFLEWLATVVAAGYFVHALM